MIYDDLVHKFGTPLYIYSLDRISTQHRKLRSILPRDAVIFYSVKSNPLPAIVEHIANIGLGFEVCSIGELSLILKNSSARDNILVGGPVKDKLFIEKAMLEGVFKFSVESANDLTKVLDLAKLHKIVVNVFIRVNPNVSISGGLNMSGRATQFGIDEDQAINVFEEALRSDHLGKLGLHVYYGTQLKHQELKKSFVCVDELRSRIEQKLGCKLNMVNYGGGFYFPFGTAEDSLEGLTQTFDDPATDIDYFFESGRFLVGSSGDLILTIEDIKYSKGSFFLLLDGGINILGGMSGIARLMRSNFKIEKLSPSSSEGETRKYTICGPLCTPLDTLGVDIELTECSIGDRLIIRNVGAYGSTASLNNFLSHPAPTEIAIADGLFEVFKLRNGHDANK